MSKNNTNYILAVDDTPASLRLLTDILAGEGYLVRSAINGELALHAAIAQPPKLVLLDVNMPGMDGFEVCRLLKRTPELRDIPVIFVSALSDMPDKLKGFEIGGVDYVTKPFQREELLARVHTHLQLYDLTYHLEEMVEERTHSLKDSEERLRKTMVKSISAVATMVELRDPYTAGHQQRVAKAATAIAAELDLPKSQIEGINLAAAVHDIGKISVPSEILSKPGRLSDPEFALIKQHPDMGYGILKEIEFPWPIADTVRQHHERVDGNGYPLGLRGDQILLEARILAVADTIEAMASHRPYRAGLGIEKALLEIEKNHERHFDVEVVNAALRLFRENGFSLDE
jgi:response regulator RpfG family c-di-GMP phosphodiesterase